MQEAVAIDVSYSPQSIVLAYRAIMTSDLEKQILKVKGIYLPAGTTNYNGYYYDKLKEESSDFAVTLLVPVLVRSKLKANSLIEFYGIVSSKVSRYGGIELQINLTDLVEQRASQFTEEDEKKIELLNRKIDIGYRDVDAFIKKCIFEKRPISIKAFVSLSRVPERDIKTALATGISFYNIEFEGISMHNAQDLSERIQECDGKVDLICVARGGGDSVVIFDKPGLAECALELEQSYLISAVGHDSDTPIFEKVADKKFATPTALGNYLREIYNNTVEEFENSKAKLVDDVTKQLQGKYELQIKTLNESRIEMTRLFADKEKLLNSQVSQLSMDKTKLEGMIKQNTTEIQRLNQETQNLYRKISDRSSNTGAIIIALIIGIVIGLVIFAVFSG